MNILKICWGIAIITLFTSLYIINGLPAGVELPIHWGIDGEIDRYTDASVAFLFPPAVMVVMLSVLSVLRKIDPRKKNIQLSHKSIGACSLAITLLMLVLEISYIAMHNGIEVPMMLVLSFVIGLVFIVIGNYLTKTRSNFFIGIRTPWTLSSDLVWQKTHRLGGKLFMVAGLIIAISCWFIPANIFIYLIIGTVLPAAIIPTVYSWWLWKQEQNHSMSSNEQSK